MAASSKSSTEESVRDALGRPRPSVQREKDPAVERDDRLNVEGALPLLVLGVGLLLFAVVFHLESPTSSSRFSNLWELTVLIGVVLIGAGLISLFLAEQVEERKDKQAEGRKSTTELAPPVTERVITPPKEEQPPWWEGPPPRIPTTRVSPPSLKGPDEPFSGAQGAESNEDETGRSLDDIDAITRDISRRSPVASRSERLANSPRPESVPLTSRFVNLDAGEAIRELEGIQRDMVARRAKEPGTRS